MGDRGTWNRLLGREGRGRGGKGVRGRFAGSVARLRSRNGKILGKIFGVYVCTACVYVYVYKSLYCEFVCVCKYRFIHVYMYRCICVRMYVYVYVVRSSFKYVLTYIFVYIGKYAYTYVLHNPPILTLTFHTHSSGVPSPRHSPPKMFL